MNLLPTSTALFPYTTLFRSGRSERHLRRRREDAGRCDRPARPATHTDPCRRAGTDDIIPLDPSPSISSTTVADFKEPTFEDRKSTRLNSSHITISYAVFCLK